MYINILVSFLMLLDVRLWSSQTHVSYFLIHVFAAVLRATLTKSFNIQNFNS
jgi:hypothetical protein